MRLCQDFEFFWRMLAMDLILVCPPWTHWSQSSCDGVMGIWVFLDLDGVMRAVKDHLRLWTKKELHHPSPTWHSPASDETGWKSTGGSNCPKNGGEGKQTHLHWNNPLSWELTYVYENHLVLSKDISPSHRPNLPMCLHCKQTSEHNLGINHAQTVAEVKLLLMILLSL